MFFMPDAAFFLAFQLEHYAARIQQARHEKERSFLVRTLNELQQSRNQSPQNLLLCYIHYW